MSDPSKGNPRKAARSGRGIKLSPGHKDVENVLLPDEAVLLEGGIHWGIYWKAVAVALVALLLYIFIPGGYNLAVLFGAVAVVMALIAWLTKYYLALIMTDRRVLARWGILNLDYVDMRYSQIESAETFRPLMGRILGYGSVIVAGTGQRKVIIPYVGNAGAFRLALNEILLKRERKAD